MQVLVREPSVFDTINILRGLKEKYEAHHGVRVADRALGAAAELSARYITVGVLLGCCGALPTDPSILLSTVSPSHRVFIMHQ